MFRIYPLHDSHRVQLIRLSNYQKHIGAVKDWYVNEHDNWYSLDGERSQWFVWEKAKQIALATSQHIQHYLERIGKGQAHSSLLYADHNQLYVWHTGKAASIANMCITPSEFAQHLGDYYEYCPVSLELDGELVDCSNEPSLKYAVEYKCKYYKMSCQEKVEQFLANPEQYVGELATRKLPPNELLPKVRSADDVKKMFPQKLELKGFCPVTYVSGNKRLQSAYPLCHTQCNHNFCFRYESLVRGDPSLVVEYNKKLFCFVSQSAVERFLR